MIKSKFSIKKENKKAHLIIYLTLAVIGVFTFIAFTSAHAESFTGTDSQSSDRSDLSGASGDMVSKHSVVKMVYESINLPNDQFMGIIGTTYLIDIGHGIYVGPAAYGAVTGKQGGFFTLGGELAWHYPLFSKLELQTGIYAGGGGGGGGTSMWGGGLMLRPHVDFLWDFGLFKAGITASNVSFPNGGNVHSDQIGFTIAIDSNFSYYTSDNVGRSLVTQSRQGFGGDRIMATVGSYFHGTGIQKNGGASSESHMGYIGARYERFMTPWLYLGLEGTGAFSGDSQGYAEYLGTMGVETSILNNWLTIGSRFALGMGGGGGVSVGGGLLGKMGAYATYNINRSIHFSLEGGYAVAPDGDFRAPYCSANLAFDLDHPFDIETKGIVDGYEFIFGSSHYFAAKTKNGDQHDIDLVTIKVNRYLNDYIYLTGQGNSAYYGQAGAFSAGMIGAGYRSPIFADRLSAGAEMLVGTAGGNLLDTEGGLSVQPMAYLGMQLTKVIGIKLSAGQIISIKGSLNSPVLDLAICFNYGANSR
jgi:hypothetical protein